MTEVSMASIRRRMEEANAAHVAAHDPMELPRTPRLSLVVVSCMDCRMTGRLEAALGLRAGDALMVRVAGNTFAGTDDLSRSLALAIFDQGARHVLVVGHTDCGLARVDTLAFAEAVNARRVSRMAFGVVPMREWLGAFSKEAENVRATVEGIRRDARFPRDIEVAGALFDVRTGRVTWLDE